METTFHSLSTKGLNAEVRGTGHAVGKSKGKEGNFSNEPKSRLINPSLY